LLLIIPGLTIRNITEKPVNLTWYGQGELWWIICSRTW